VFRLQPKAPPKTVKLPAPAAKAPVPTKAAPAKATPAAPKPIPLDAPLPARRSKRKAAARRPSRQLLYVAAGVLLVVVAIAAFWFGRGFWSLDIPESEWLEFAPPGAGCRVLLPGQPRETRSESGALTSYKYSVEREITKRGYTGVPVGALMKAFTLEWTDRSTVQAAFDRVYASARDSIIRECGGTLISERDVKLGPNTGKEFVIEPNVEGIVIGRFFLIDDRSYVLLAFGAQLTPGAGDAARFLESFQLKR
jgi:hypothetical protein